MAGSSLSFIRITAPFDRRVQSPLDRTKGSRPEPTSLTRRYSGASDIFSPELLDARSKWKSQLDHEAVSGREALPSLSTAARTLICIGTATMIVLILGICKSKFSLGLPGPD